MKKRLLILVLALVAGGFTSQLTLGDSIRCGNKVLTSGDSRAMVSSRCGKPASKDSGYEVVYRNGSRVRTHVERWRYKGRGGKLEKTVVFHNGQVAKVLLGRRR